MTGGYSLIGDIGGTNARFALVRPNSVRLEQIRVLPVREHENLDAAAHHYLREIQLEVADISAACFAFAGPVHLEHIKLTNSHWAFSKDQMREQLGVETLKLVNDFTAMALSIPYLAKENLVQVGGGPVQDSLPKLAIGPGTGLGTAGLVRASCGWIPLAAEGGHVDFAATTPLEIQILQKLTERFGRVSVERILSGQGLVNLYQCHCELQGQAPIHCLPKEITGAALSGQDPMAAATLGHFCEILGRVAGNATLTLGALGGVYIVGGIIPRFVEFFRQSGFRAAFEDKGRMKVLMEQIPVQVVVEPHPGLIGAAAALSNSEV